jgi:hypothetical protein
MLDLTLVARQGSWFLEDEAGGVLGRFPSRADALAAAGVYAYVAAEPRVVLICDDAGEWDETVVEPGGVH